MPKEEKPKSTGLNIKSFIKGDPEAKSMKIPIEPEIVSDMLLPNNIEQNMLNNVGIATKKKLDSVNKKKSTGPHEIPQAQTSMDYLQQNIPYEQGYAQSDAMLDETIAQLNSLSLETANDMNVVRNSKTMKNKYYLLTGIMGNAVNILNTKLSAIKEKNKVRNDINNLEIKRIKDLKIDSDMKDDNTRMAELYSAFVNTPVGMMSAQQGMGLSGLMNAPSQQSFLMPGVSALDRMSVTNPSLPSGSWEAGLDPVQNRMLLQAKGVMDIVVLYDEVTGSRRYAAIDKNSHTEIPNVELPDPSTIYDLDINVRGGYAKDSNRNVVYPLIVNSSSPNMTGF